MHPCIDAVCTLHTVVACTAAGPGPSHIWERLPSTTKTHLFIKKTIVSSYIPLLKKEIYWGAKIKCTLLTFVITLSNRVQFENLWFADTRIKVNTKWQQKCSPLLLSIRLDAQHKLCEFVLWPNLYLTPGQRVKSLFGPTYLTMQPSRDANPVDNSSGNNGGYEVCRNAVQPRQEQCNFHHPTAVALAVVDRMDDLPVAIQGNDHQTRRCSIHRRYSQSCTVEKDAKSHSSWARVVVVFKYSRYIQRESQCNAYAGN